MVDSDENIKFYFNVLVILLSSYIVPKALPSSIPMAKNCFIALEKGTILKQEGDCFTAYSPQSTFKLVLSLIGFDSGILHDVNSPIWSMPRGADPYVNVCKGDHDPRSWMRDSCLWYSNILTGKLGMKKFTDYVNKLSFGNRDLTGGLTSSWVSSSLKISPYEYVEFLTRLVEHKLPVDKSAYQKTKEIMYIQELPGGFKLYGKTGNGDRIDAQGHNTDMQQGWFVGYIEKDEEKIVFASHLVDDQKRNTFASMRARNEALLKLWPLINERFK